MKLITKNTDYAMRALSYMAKKKGDIVSVSDLVMDLKIPRPFLRGILQVLEKRGVVRPYKGKRGGFLLALPPDKIFLTALIKIFQGPLRFNECFIKKKICPDVRACLLRRKITKIKKYVIAELRTITIESLLG